MSTVGWGFFVGMAGLLGVRRWSENEGGLAASVGRSVGVEAHDERRQCRVESKAEG